MVINHGPTSYSALWMNITDMLQEVCDEIFANETNTLNEITKAINGMRGTFQKNSEETIREFTVAALDNMYRDNDYVKVLYEQEKDINNTSQQSRSLSNAARSDEQDCSCACHNAYSPSVPDGSAIIPLIFGGIFKYLFKGPFGSILTIFTTSCDMSVVTSATMGTIKTHTDRIGVGYDDLIEMSNASKNNRVPELPSGSSTCGSNCSCECHDNPPREPGSSSPVPDAHQALIPRTDPLILDLNHNGVIDTQGSENGTLFDIDGNDAGIKETVGWASNGDGFLVQDSNDNGQIDGINEMFGGASINAFDDLRTRIDSNGDRIIDKNDILFHTLKVWIDSNNNGITDDNELYTLESLGITSINTDKTLINKVNNGNNISHISSFIQNGETHISASVDFNTNQTLSYAEGMLYVPDLLLPLLRGYGDVKDIIFEMYNNSELRSLVYELANKDDNYTKANFEKLLVMRSTPIF